MLAALRASIASLLMATSIATVGVPAAFGQDSEQPHWKEPARKSAPRERAAIDEDAGKIPCTQVVAELNRRVTRGMGRGLEPMAKALGTEPAWIEQCLAIHGRRVRGPRFGSVPEVQREDPFNPDTPVLKGIPLD